jgi:hypothetical protein
MIKKPTLIVLLCAILLGGVYYYLNWKSGKAEKAPADTPKAAFAIQASDVASIAVAHPAKPDQPLIKISRAGGNWQIAQPVETAADSSVVDQSIDNLASARITQTEPDTPDRLKAFGLDPPKVSVELQLKNGAKHTLLIGDKVFDGSSVYAIVDGAKSVSVLPDSVLTSSDKSLDDFRDHTILHITSDQVASFTLKNPSGELALTKSKDQWAFTKPADTRADQDSISAVLTAIQTGKFTGVGGEKPDDLGKYGLASPAVNLTATDDTGKKSTLLVGKKEGNDYFARDTSRPTIFRIPGDLYTQLTKSFADLRDKKVLHFDSADLTGIEVHNDHGTIVADTKGSDTWTIESPAAQKGKNSTGPKLFDPLSGLHSDQIVDRPGADLASKLAKPAIEVILTDKNKKTITLKVSKPAGDVVYAQASDSPSVYKLKKQDFDNLNFDASTLIE